MYILFGYFQGKTNTFMYCFLNKNQSTYKRAFETTKQKLADMNLNVKFGPSSTNSNLWQYVINYSFWNIFFLFFFYFSFIYLFIFFFFCFCYFILFDVLSSWYTAFFLYCCWVEVLRPSQPIRVMSSQSVYRYLPTVFLSRLSPLSS